MDASTVPTLRSYENPSIGDVLGRMNGSHKQLIGSIGRFFGNISIKTERMRTMHNKPYKSRTKSVELLVMEVLFKRMNLSEKDLQRYFNLKKGFEGEVMFDSFTEKLQCECYILNDLLLQVNNTTFQIDSLIIHPETIYFYEVKNYDGDYYFESNRFYKKPKFEYSNPFYQLERNESLLRQFLNSFGYKMSIDASVVFINPEFALYQAPLNKPFIFPTQLNQHLKKLDTSPSKLNGKHKILADKLMSMHTAKSPYSQFPTYNYEQLQQGITCVECDSFSIFAVGKKVVCKECGAEETVQMAVLRNVQEYKLLFPKQKITTNFIHEWCNRIISKKRIRNILGKNFKIIGVHQWAYYE